MDNGEIIKFFPDEDAKYLGYWNKRKKAFGMNVWGSDRVRECIEAIIKWLGFEVKNEEIYNKAVLL